MHKPRVLIAMATSILGGPGKGLVQFLRHGGLEGCQPWIIDYHAECRQKETDFEKAIKVTGGTLVPLRQRKTFDIGLVKQAFDLVRKQKITLLQSHGYKSHVLCGLLKQKTGLPWLAFVHGWTRENLRIRAYTALEHILLFGADEVVGVSESLRLRLLPPIRRRCRVIPNALAEEELQANCFRDEVRSALRVPEDAILVGIVGRLSPEKGHRVFLRALSAARQHDPRLWGLIMGDGQERQTLETEAQRLGIERVCVFTGHVNNTANLYSAMDMQVLSSFTEGMPNVILEGMYMGLPVIATRVGGVPEVVEENRTGILINSGDEDALAESMLKLSASPEQREVMGRAGTERIRAHFSPRIRTGRILKLYHEILANKPRREGPTED
ncbi:glycosyltransferase [Desulfosarcina sp. OttesenSCG-928-G10]|nr:glycosyltransferase [Desulfosarcina sp. OttesenSCG-928-G10]